MVYATIAIIQRSVIHMKMRRFELHRDVDTSGVSGLGIVAEGVEFSSGVCALTWLTSNKVVAFYDNIKTVETVHGHGGNTRVVWLDV